MVNELRELLHRNAATPPLDSADISAVLKGGRRRVRRRRLAVVGLTAVATAAAIGLTPLIWPSPPDLAAAGVPAPDAPTLRLTDAKEAVAGEDYRVLASHTNDDLHADNGQYFDGVTDDGMILFRDGPRMAVSKPRLALMDPRSGAKDWLPSPPVSGDEQLWPAELATDRLVLTGLRYDDSLKQADEGLPQARPYALVYDRGARAWSRVEWPELPLVDRPVGDTLGADGRLYVRVPATQGQPPPGGWPIGPDGEADDADADGDTYHLWSASLTDPADVRDERLVVGDVAFTEDDMVWTDSTNGGSGRVHVRDLDTGEETSFDPQSGERCNLLSFGATDTRIVMGQYCGTYAGNVRDDRVQVMSTDGDQVVTLQDDSIDGYSPADSGLVTVTSYQRGQAGSYVYDLETDRFLRISDDVSQWASGGPAPARHFLWSTPENFRNGATQWLGEILD